MYLFVYLELLKWMVRGCEPSLAEGVYYYQRCVLFWVMVKRPENSVLVKAGEMSLVPEWKLDVQGAEIERWATFHG